MRGSFFYNSAFAIAAILNVCALAAMTSPELEKRAPNLTDLLKESLSKIYPEARIELGSSVKWLRGQLSVEQMSKPASARILSESPSGEARFAVLSEAGSSTEAEGIVQFTANVSALVANRRVYPGEKLARDAFSKREINVASGMMRELRGILLAPETDLAGLESRQTILEGTSLVSSAIQKIPDIRKGEAVQIKVMSGSIQLSTQGTAEEPAYYDSQVRVMAQKTKRELQGTLRPGGVVEVNL